MLVSWAGLNFDHQPGDIVDMSDAQAVAWCDGDRAELVNDATPERARRRGERLERTVTT